MRVGFASSNKAGQGGDDECFSSPLLREALTRIDPAERHVILEPGAVSPGILSLVQGTRCRLLVADAAMALSRLDDMAEEKLYLAHEVERLIEDAGKEKIDTVLCWDLLNYMSLPLLSIFAARLAAIMSPSGLVHAYIHSAESSMPQCPQRYALRGDNHVMRLDGDPPVRKVPRYSYGDLEKHAGGLRVARSMLLRNGMQEYLLRNG